MVKQWGKVKWKQEELGKENSKMQSFFKKIKPHVAHRWAYQKKIHQGIGRMKIKIKKEN